MRIPVLIEPDYRQSIWCYQTLSGLYAEAARKRYELTQVGTDWDADAFFGTDKRLAIVIGTSGSWVPDMLRTLSAKNVGALLVSYQLEAEGVSGTVMMDYVGAICELRAFLADTGCLKPALYGINPNSSADQLKRRAFDNESAVFENRASLADCWRAFEARLGEFDAVICANDIVAVSLMERLQASGVNVPGQMRMVSFGDSLLARVVKPGITTASLDHEALGREAVSLYAYLTRHDGVAVNARVRCRIAVRGSTGRAISDRSTDYAERGTGAVDFYEDDEVRRIMAAENFLSGCDEMDLMILASLMDGESGERLAERGDLAERTVRYRLRRLIDRSGMPDRRTLTDFLTARLDGDSLRCCAEELIRAKRRHG